MERVWGGRRLESLFGKRLPPGVRIGESWEMVDRTEAQSVVRDGPLRGRTLNHLWVKHRREIFGDVADASRFPLLVKLLDAQEKLSVQVHPPARAARELGGEPKTEFWYIANAAPAAEIYVGLAKKSSPERFAAAVVEGSVSRHLHRIAVRTGDNILLPSGRVHAIGAGNVLVEIQQNSDTTYRVFDWNRPGSDGRARELHVEQSLRCIDFGDVEPDIIKPEGESLVRSEFFSVEKWELTAPREIGEPNRCVIVGCVAGGVECGGVPLAPGNFLLVPACLGRIKVKALRPRAELLRVTIGKTSQP